MLNVLHRSKQKSYKFDHIFTDESCNDIFSTCIESNIEHCLAGNNCCVFAYGATGSGKTYTMFGGTNEGAWHPGIIEISLQHVFQRIYADEKKDYNIIASCLEIYNENIVDLLRSPKEVVPLELWDEPEHGLVIPNLLKVSINSMDNVGQDYTVL